MSSDDNSQAEVIAFLQDPATHGGQAVERIDTHIASVFLAGERAFKLKRAVAFPYLDFTGLAERERVCRRELDLNRAAAPELYLGVKAITREAEGRLAFDGKGEVLDYVVEMRRFPQEALLDRLARKGGLTEPICLGLAERIAAYHDAAAVIREAGAAQAMRQILEAALNELKRHEHLLGAERLQSFIERLGEAFADISEEIERRGQDGKVIRGHGDLHLRNIVLWKGKPLLFDALEFDERLATADRLYDLAFLLMDLRHRGLEAFANRLLNRYLAMTGDYSGLQLLHFFLALRAAIRAMVLAETAAKGDDEKAPEARDYLSLALDFLEPLPPCLIALGGLSGSGKTATALALAPSLGRGCGAIVLRSDERRKRLWGVKPEQPLPQEAYDEDWSRRVYEDLRETAALLLRSGAAVVLDAVHARLEERKAAERVARDVEAAFLGLWLEAPPETLAERVGLRAHGLPDASDADAAVVAAQSRYDLGEIAWRRLSAEAAAEAVLEEALAACRQSEVRASLRDRRRRPPG